MTESRGSRSVPLRFHNNGSWHKHASAQPTSTKLAYGKASGVNSSSPRRRATWNMSSGWSPYYNEALDFATGLDAGGARLSSEDAVAAAEEAEPQMAPGGGAVKGQKTLLSTGDGVSASIHVATAAAGDGKRTATVSEQERTVDATHAPRTPALGLGTAVEEEAAVTCGTQAALPTSASASGSNSLANSNTAMASNSGSFNPEWPQATAGCAAGSTEQPTATTSAVDDVLAALHPCSKHNDRSGEPLRIIAPGGRDGASREEELPGDRGWTPSDVGEAEGLKLPSAHQSEPESPLSPTSGKSSPVTRDMLLLGSWAEHPAMQTMRDARPLSRELPMV